MRAALVLVVLSVCAVADGHSQTRQGEEAGLSIFQTANEGRLADAIQQLRRVSDIRSIDRLVRQTAPIWIGDRTSEDSGRRRLVVAVLALAFARDAYEQLEQRYVRDKYGLSPALVPWAGRTAEAQAVWPQLKLLLEWSCELVRANPTPLEREWLIASVQLFKDFADRDVDVRQSTGPLFADPAGHLAHALKRYPDDPWLRLILAERATKAEYDVIVPMLSFSLPVEQKRGLTDALTDARKLFLPLESEPLIRASVHEHLGRIAAATSDFPVARRYFSQVAAEAQNPCQQYMGHMLTSVMDERLGNSSDAEAGYRRALTLFPRAASASTALAAVLWTTDRPMEAIELLRSLHDGSPVDDPWITTFGDRECSEWGELMRPLQDFLR